MSAGVPKSKNIPNTTTLTHQADARRDLISLPSNKPTSSELRAHQRRRTLEAYLLLEQRITWGRTMVPRAQVGYQSTSSEFVNETTFTEGDEGNWLLHVDGSSTLAGSGAAVVLTSSDGDELEYALRFDFKASNNETEYEALIVETDWRKPLLDYLTEGILRANKMEAAHLKSGVARFALIEGILYKRSFSQPFLRCLLMEEGRSGLQEIHEGSCGAHIGGMALGKKTLPAGYFWPTLKKDAINWAKKCEHCQNHTTLIHVPAEPLRTLSAPCPFSQWK
ncbi:UNVERIFIED_CONTAM: hypothetical protein Slati_3807000 [Sesamum latifolium]|uniref:Integrase zinc-binding domain-containing protein n=1 Tax=Sesamum latifolium TaxID=2727402 RepID=A0AAW2U6J5_9LAMI